MTRDDIMRLAQEATLPLDLIIYDKFDELNWQRVERFAALVAAAEREECAKVCEGRIAEGLSFEGCASTIRARG